MRGEADTRSFYVDYAPEPIEGAREVLKIVKDILNPRTVVDVGCSEGHWLKVWSDLGVREFLGIDEEYVGPDELMIPIERFRRMDLNAPERLENRFDLVESLEVAEHLPEASADAFVAFLCSLGSVVLFSAAIPYQGGVHHLNEQWPEYWANLFRQKGYVPIDGIRDRVWDNPRVAVWYAQNILIFVEAAHLPVLEGLRDLPVVPPQGVLSRVHPHLWVERNEQAIGLKTLLRMLPRSCMQFASRFAGKLRGSRRQHQGFL